MTTPRLSIVRLPEIAEVDRVTQAWPMVRKLILALVPAALLDSPSYHDSGRKMAIKPPHSYVRYCTRHSRPPGRRYNVPRAGLALILFLLAAGGGRLRASKRSIAPFVSARVAALAH